MRRLNSGTDETTSRLQIVPWFNKEEWYETYQQAYSDNVSSQEKAYTQMKVWKARNPKLPLGVECCMSVLHVKLCDNKQVDADQVSPYQDRDLQLLYSTAVMRFLNHLTTMSKCKDSMYKMAEEHEIPDWLINLRHEAAHGNTVPALYLLRQAADVIMQWLKKHYWEEESNIMEDVVKDQENLKDNQLENIRCLLQLWLQLKLSHWSGYRTIDNIPDEDIRTQAMSLANEEGCGIKRTNDQDKKDVTLKHDQSLEQSAMDVEEEMAMADGDETDLYTHKIKTAFDPLLRRLFDPLRGKTHKRIKYEENLIESLVSYDGFCLCIYDLDEIKFCQEVMSLQVELWKEVLEGLQSHNLLHCLLRSLVCRSEEQPFAHLWLRLLTQALAGDSLPHPTASPPACQLMARLFPVPVKSEVLLHTANSLHVQQHRPLQLKPVTARDCDVLLDWAQQAVYHPTSFTTTYLHSLLNFWKSPLDNDTKEKLCQIARLYSGQKALKSRPDQVYTLASLLDHGLVLSQSQVTIADNNDANKLDSSIWTLYSGEADWGHCALGALPW